MEANFIDQRRYKNCIKALAFWVRKVLPSLIYYDQTAHVKGRYVGESVRLVDDLLKYAEEENSNRILFAADIEKAFDSVDHNFIFATLNKFGFGSDFILWIKTLFKNSQIKAVTSCSTHKIDQQETDG